MRSWTRLAAVAAALALSACGNYSTEDLRFLAALPQRQDLTFEVPAGGRAGALSACPPGNARWWLEAKPTSDNINAGVDFLLSLVDAVRRVPPTWRSGDARRWGPFDDEKHPGHEIEIVMSRSYPAELGGAARYTYAFEARRKGTAAFAPILAGAFDGGSASDGKGWLVLDFDAIRALGMDDPSTPAGTMQVAYDRATDPVTLQLALSAGGFGVVDFGYRYAGYAAGGGVFDFAIRDATNGNLYAVSTGFDAQGAGRAQVGFRTPGGFEGGFQQCWDAGACLVYVKDPANYSCSDPQCSFGVPESCPAVPASPF
jgi:hypothetical protein